MFSSLQMANVDGYGILYKERDVLAASWGEEAKSLMSLMH